MALIQVYTEYGYVRGVQGWNPAVSVFKGIPYAAPPTGENRFMPPKAHEPWEGVLECRNFGPAAIQSTEFGDSPYGREFYMHAVETDEDCLKLNVWTPAEEKGEKRPVLVWFHGGGYCRGYSYELPMDGEAICKRGCIMVSVGYRLGPLGFLVHPFLSERSENGISGNYGTLDQIAALKWVQRNIEAFGGDHENVTIFGQSAGGASVRSLLSSHLAKGLFHKAIIQSAGGLFKGAPSGNYKDTMNTTESIIKEMGWSPEELITKPAGTIYEDIMAASARNACKWLFRTVADGYVLNEDPNNSIKNGQIADVPVAIGNVAGDAVMSIKELEGEPYKIRRLEPIMDVLALASLYADRYQKHLYTYFFDRELPGDDWGKQSYHSCELWYEFGTLNRCWRRFTGYDYELSSAMVDYWTGFAKMLSGGETVFSNNNNAEWKPFTMDGQGTLLFGNEKLEYRSLMDFRPVSDAVYESLKNVF